LSKNLKSVDSNDPHIALEKYANLPFVPQKNEGQDRQNILLLSKEFNPLISFNVSNSNKSEK